MKKEESYVFQNCVPGDDGEQTSYQSELCGILGHILLLTRLAEYHKLQQGEVTIGCDNEAALWKALGDKSVKTGEPSFDILRVIHYHRDKLQIKWNQRHVRGHQDKQTKYEDLDPWAQANVTADHLAEDMWNRRRSIQDRPEPDNMPGEGWRVIINGRPVQQKVNEAIYKHRYRERCMAYWTKKGRINEGEGHQINWDAYGKAAQSMPRAKTQWTHKHFSGFEANNYMLHKFGERNNPICPQCNQVEQYDHIIRCKALQAERTFTKAERHYAEWLEETTDTSISQAITEILQATREERPVTMQELWPDEVRQLVTEQQTVGGRSFIEGCIHKQWEGIQKNTWKGHTADVHQNDG